MQINRPQLTQIKSPSTSQSQVKQSPVERTESSVGSIARDVAAIGVGTGGAIAGGVYGLAEGLVKGGIENYPKHLSAGSKLGRNIATPVGGALGAIATGTTVALAALGTPVATVLAVGTGLVGGTLLSAVKHTPSSVVETAQKGAAVGARVGSGLGAVGSAVGTFVGGTLGGVAGLAVAVAKGVPDGLGLAKEGLVTGYKAAKNLPQLAKDTWQIAYPGGRQVAGTTGAAVGALGGFISATGETGIDGVANSISKGAQWGKASHDWVGGKG